MCKCLSWETQYQHSPPPTPIAMTILHITNSLMTSQKAIESQLGNLMKVLKKRKQTIIMLNIDKK